MTTIEQTQEQRVRRPARRQGYGLKKSRAQIHINNLGEYMVFDLNRNFVVMGERYDATLDEIEEWLKEG